MSLHFTSYLSQFAEVYGWSCLDGSHKRRLSENNVWTYSICLYLSWHYLHIVLSILPRTVRSCHWYSMDYRCPLRSGYANSPRRKEEIEANAADQKGSGRYTPGGAKKGMTAILLYRKWSHPIIKAKRMLSMKYIKWNILPLARGRHIWPHFTLGAVWMQPYL